MSVSGKPSKEDNELEKMGKDLKKLRGEYDALDKVYGRNRKDRNKLRKQVEKLKKENEKLTLELKQTTEDRDHLRLEMLCITGQDAEVRVPSSPTQSVAGGEVPSLASSQMTGSQTNDKSSQPSNSTPRRYIKSVQKERPKIPPTTITLRKRSLSTNSLSINPAIISLEAAKLLLNYTGGASSVVNGEEKVAKEGDHCWLSTDGLLSEPPETGGLTPLGPINEVTRRLFGEETEKEKEKDKHSSPVPASSPLHSQSQAGLDLKDEEEEEGEKTEVLPKGVKPGRGRSGQSLPASKKSLPGQTLPASKSSRKRKGSVSKPVVPIKRNLRSNSKVNTPILDALEDQNHPPDDDQLAADLVKTQHKAIHRSSPLKTNPRELTKETPTVEEVIPPSDVSTIGPEEERMSDVYTFVEDSQPQTLSPLIRHRLRLRANRGISREEEEEENKVAIMDEEVDGKNSSVSKELVNNVDEDEETEAEEKEDDEDEAVVASPLIRHRLRLRANRGSDEKVKKSISREEEEEEDEDAIMDEEVDGKNSSVSKELVNNVDEDEETEAEEKEDDEDEAAVAKNSINYKTKKCILKEVTNEVEDEEEGEDVGEEEKDLSEEEEEENVDIGFFFLNNNKIEKSISKEVVDEVEEDDDDEEDEEENPLLWLSSNHREMLEKTRQEYLTPTESNWWTWNRAATFVKLTQNIREADKIIGFIDKTVNFMPQFMELIALAHMIGHQGWVVIVLNSDLADKHLGSKVKKNDSELLESKRLKLVFEPEGKVNLGYSRRGPYDVAVVPSKVFASKIRGQLTDECVCLSNNDKSIFTKKDSEGCFKFQ